MKTTDNDSFHLFNPAYVLYFSAICGGIKKSRKDVAVASES